MIFFCSATFSKRKGVFPDLAAGGGWDIQLSSIVKSSVSHHDTSVR